MIDDNKQKKLKNCFLKMAKTNTPLSDEEIRAIVNDMKQNIYDNQDFRHRYSDFFKWIADIYAEGEVQDPSPLGENIAKLSKAVKSEYENLESSSLSTTQKNKIKRKLGNIEKFCDHLNLSLAEHEYNRATLVKLESSENIVSSLQSDFQDIQKDFDDKSKHLSVKIESLQLEFITILSIFAAIVIATAGGFSYITAAVASLDSEIPLHRTICVIAIAGFFLFNSVFILLYIISKIADKPIHTFCEEYNFQKKGNLVDTKSCQSCKNSCHFFIKLYRRLPYVFWFNLGTAIILLIVLIRWLFIYRSF